MKRIAALIVVIAAAGAVSYWSTGTDSGLASAVRRTQPARSPDAAARPVTAGTPAPHPGLQTATFSSGCFWCTESDFDTVPGVVSTTSGYTGGRLFRPTYRQVSAGGTGHVESVELAFDPTVVTYEQLLDVYWHNVDPFNDHGQFCDYGEQYRPVIWVHDEAQRVAATASRAGVEQLLGKRVRVEIQNAGPFYEAEDYHQDFHSKNPVRYRFYRWSCGRDARLGDIWDAVSD